MKPSLTIYWQQHGLTSALGLAAFVFLVVVGVETDWGAAVRPPLPTANGGSRPAEIVAALPVFAMPPLETAFKETADRPLFTPTRRPAAVNLAANVPAMKKGQFKLNGTSVSNELALAFLFETATGKTVRITKGKEINGMTLDIVEANRIVLKQGDETEELTLRTAASPPKPLVPVLVPGSPPSIPGVPPGTPPTGVANVVSVPPATRPQSAFNPLVPLPGSSQLPGFVMPSAVTPQITQAVPQSEGGDPGQRRRRFQTAPQK